MIRASMPLPPQSIQGLRYVHILLGAPHFLAPLLYVQAISSPTRKPPPLTLDSDPFASERTRTRRPHEASPRRARPIAHMPSAARRQVPSIGPRCSTQIRSDGAPPRLNAQLPSFCSPSFHAPLQFSQEICTPQPVTSTYSIWRRRADSQQCDSDGRQKIRAPTIR